MVNKVLCEKLPEKNSASRKTARKKTGCCRLVAAVIFECQQYAFQSFRSHFCMTIKFVL